MEQSISGQKDEREPDSFTGVDLDMQEANQLRRINLKLGLTKPISAKELAEMRLMPIQPPNRHARRRARKLARRERNRNSRT